MKRKEKESEGERKGGGEGGRKKFQIQRRRKNLLVDTMSGRGHPVLVDEGPPASVGGGEAEEGGAAHRHLVGERELE